MKATNSCLAVAEEEDDGFVTLVLAFQLHGEDFRIVDEVVRPAIERQSRKKADTADALLACLTYGIHRAYEDAEGVKFTLRMDRKKNKS